MSRAIWLPPLPPSARDTLNTTPATPARSANSGAATSIRTDAGVSAARALPDSSDRASAGVRGSARPESAGARTTTGNPPADTGADCVSAADLDSNARARAADDDPTPAPSTATTAEPPGGSVRPPRFHSPAVSDSDGGTEVTDCARVGTDATGLPPGTPGAAAASSGTDTTPATNATATTGATAPTRTNHPASTVPSPAHAPRRSQNLEAHRRR